MLAAAINSKDPGMVVEVLRCTQDTCSGDEVTCDTKLIDGWSSRELGQGILSFVLQRTLTFGGKPRCSILR